MTGELRGMKESLYPLMSQLANVEGQVLLNPSRDDEVKLLFQSIQASLKSMVDVFDPMKKLEEELEKDLQELARQIDNMLRKLLDPETEETDLAKQLNKIANRACAILDSLKTHMESGFGPGQKPEDGQPEKRNTDDSSSSYAWLDKDEERRDYSTYFEKAGAITTLQNMIDDLDLQVKHCFFSLGVFPEKSIIKKRLLINLWIGMGIVVPVGDSTGEQIAERCFSELMIKGLVRPIYKKHRDSVDSCIMDSKIREVMISVAERRRFFLSEDETSRTLKEMIISEPEALTKGSWRVMRYSRVDSLALVNINEQYLQFQSNYADQTSKKEPGNMDKFAVMQLGRWESGAQKPSHIEMESIEFLNNMGNKNKLGYLSLQGVSRITKLPDSIGKLSNLIILDLRACHNLESLPDDLCSLKKLTHLDVSNCYLLDHLPSSIESLTNMQVLKGFIIGYSFEHCSFYELRRMKKLRKLSIIIGRESVVAHTGYDLLHDLKALRSMTITWGMVGSKDDTAIELPDLVIPPELEKLDLRAFPGTKFPWKWLYFRESKLKRLYIRGGKLENLYSEEYYPKDTSLEVLRLRFLANLSIERAQLPIMFPGLSYMEASDCPKIKHHLRELLDEDGVWRGQSLFSFF